MEIQDRVSPPTEYVPSTLGSMPDPYIIAAATYTMDTFAGPITNTRGRYVGYLDFVQGETARQYVKPMLTFAITVTSQYLVAWMQAGMKEDIIEASE